MSAFNEASDFVLELEVFVAKHPQETASDSFRGRWNLTTPLLIRSSDISLIIY